MAKISVIGTGLIGTSLGLALQQSQLKDIEVVGSDSNRQALDGANKRHAFHRIERRLANAIDGADIVVLATPVMAMKELMEYMGPELPEGCVVTDVGSSKRVVLEWADQHLPSQVDFVGGHPMAGKETAGPEAAEAELFRNKPYCVIPSDRAGQQAVGEITTMIEAIGGSPYFIGVEEHDSFVAAASHLPFLLSMALVGCTSKSANWEDIAQLASTGYRDLTRLASGDPVMHRDICITNAQPIVAWIDAYIRELYEFRRFLDPDGEPDAEQIKEVFDQLSVARAKWLAGEVNPQARQLNPNREPLPSFGEGVGQLFLGGKLMEAQKRMFGGGWGDSNRDKK